MSFPLLLLFIRIQRSELRHGAGKIMEEETERLREQLQQAQAAHRETYTKLRKDGSL